MELIDKNSVTPYYIQLAEILKRQIATPPPPGEKWRLPSENELAALHGITRTTVRRALEILEREGWIYKEKGKGSFAVARRVGQEVTQLVSTTEYMRARGWNLTTRVISLEKIIPPAKIASALTLSESDLCYQLRRLRLVDDEPISIQTSYLPARLCPDLESNDLSASLYQLLETRYKLRLWNGEQVIRARCATAEERKLLQVKPCTAVLYMERVSYAATGEPVEYLEAVWRGDRYEFKASLARPR